jgi:hypothetical protein
MLYIKRGLKIHDSSRFCPKSGTEVNVNITLSVQQKNKDISNSSAVSKKKFTVDISIAAVVFLIILGITCCSKDKSPLAKNHIKKNPVEDTIWEYSTGLSLFDLGVKRNITIEFTATKYNLTNANKLGFGDLGIDFPSAETGSYIITDDNMIILTPDSGYSVNLASLSELKEDFGESLSTLWDKLLSNFSDEENKNESVIASSEQDKSSEARKYTGLLTKKTLTIGDKIFKRM